MNKNKQEAIDKLIALIPEKERQFIKENKDSDNPEIKGRINDIYIKYGVVEEMFNPSGYLLSEDNLLEWAKEGPEAKAAAQFFLGRIIDNEGYWDVPDYRNHSTELNKANGNLTNNDLYLFKNNWLREDIEQDGVVKYREWKDDNPRKLSINSNNSTVTISQNSEPIELSFNEILAILQKCREMGMKEPDSLLDFK